MYDSAWFSPHSDASSCFQFVREHDPIGPLSSRSYVCFSSRSYVCWEWPVVSLPIFMISKLKLQLPNVALLEQWHLLFHFACYDLVVFITGELVLVIRPH